MLKAIKTAAVIAAILLSAMAAGAVDTAHAAGYRDKYPLPGLAVPDGWGVNIHSAGMSVPEIDLIANGGFSWVRMDFTWAEIERVKGKYNFMDYDRLLNILKGRSMRLLAILDYGNDLYGGGAPRTPEAREAFAKFAAAAVDHFRGKGVVWEMWNEPNIPQFWQPQSNVEEYIALATAVGKAIRATAPDEWYVGPATSTFDYAFLEACFKGGLLQYWDAVTVHPYRPSNPETVAPDWARLRQLIHQYAPTKNMPMISGEWGYSDVWEGMNLELQTRYILRQYLVNLASGVGMSIWYDWKDDGADRKNPEHHFGAVTIYLNPKTTYLAAKLLAQKLQGKSYVMRLAQADSADWVLVFSGHSGVAAVGWTTTIPQAGKPSPKIDNMPQLLDKRVVPTAVLVRAGKFAGIPLYATIVSEKDAADLLAPLVAKLGAKEKLLVYDWAAGETADRGPRTAVPITLKLTDKPRLRSLCVSLARTPAGERTWRVVLVSPGIVDIAQECAVSRAAAPGPR